MTILGFLQVHAHYFPAVTIAGVGIFIGLGIGALYAMERASGGGLP